MPSLATRLAVEGLRVVAVKRTDAISGSHTEPSIVLSAADVGTTVTITIAAHTRRYGDETGLAVAGGTVTLLSFSTPYAVYYDDVGRSNPAPTYHATSTVKQGANNYVPGRHFVGELTTPADGAGATTGGTYPAGGGGSFAIP